MSTPTNTPSTQTLLDKLERSYADLVQALALLEPEELESARLANGWTPKATLAHVAFWDAFQTRRMQAALAGESAETGVTWPQEDNDQRAARDAQRPWHEIQEEAERARQGLIDFAAGLTPEALARPYPEGQGQLDLLALLTHMVKHAREHAQEIWAYATSLERWSREDARAFLERQFTHLLDAIGGLDEESLTTVPVCGVWSARDVLTHVLAWEEYGRLVMEQWPQVDRADLAPWLEGTDIDAINAGLLAQKEDQTLIDLLDGLASVQRRTLAFFDQASDPLLASQGDYGWGQEGSLLSFLFDLAWHRAEHAADLWRARAEGRLTPVSVPGR